jgi:hypothetical protein
MTPNQSRCTLQVAVHYAGSFFSALAQAGLTADPANRERLLQAFPEFEQQYGPGTAFYQRMFP